MEITFCIGPGNFGNSKDDRFSGIYVSSLDDRTTRLIVLCRSSFGYDSQNLYFADGQRRLVRIPFDLSSAHLSGAAVAVADAVGLQPSTYRAALTVSTNGNLIYSTGVGAALSILTWVDRSGKELGRIGDPAIIANPTLSPDGSRVAADVADLKANNVDIWLESTHGAGNSRFTFDPAEEVAAVWSRDGSKLAYRSVFLEGVAVMNKAANGLEREKVMERAGPVNDFVPNSWSADNKQILITEQAPQHSYLAIVPAAGGARVPFMTTTANETNGLISDDGKWVAYASDESGNWEVYVTSFPGAVGKWQVSRGGGSEPRWRADGKEIFYIGANGMLIAVSVNTENGFSTGAPAPLFQSRGRAPIQLPTRLPTMSRTTASSFWSTDMFRRST